MANKLDRSRDYGTIQGDDQGRMFEQDGAYFTGDGSEWSAPSEPKKAGKGKAAAAPAADTVDDGAVAAELDQVDAQLQG